jgi:hypothetical protein
MDGKKVALTWGTKTRECGVSSFLGISHIELQLAMTSPLNPLVVQAHSAQTPSTETDKFEECWDLGFQSVIVRQSTQQYCYVISHTSIALTYQFSTWKERTSRAVAPATPQLDRGKKRRGGRSLEIGAG